MRNNNHRLRKYGGYVFGFAVFCLLTAATIVSAAEGTGKVRVKPLPGIPEDFDIVYDHGATNAARGRTTCRISADGMVECEKSRVRRGAVERPKTYYRLSKGEIRQIMGTIEKNRFFSLDGSYSNPRIRDGSSSHIRVTMNNLTHSVSVINTHQKEFGEIAGVINDIIGRKRPVTPE